MKQEETICKTCGTEYNFVLPQNICAGCRKYLEGMVSSKLPNKEECKHTGTVKDIVGCEICHPTKLNPPINKEEETCPHGFAECELCDAYKDLDIKYPFSPSDKTWEEEHFVEYSDWDGKTMHVTFGEEGKRERIHFDAKQTAFFFKILKSELHSATIKAKEEERERICKLFQEGKICHNCMGENKDGELSDWCGECLENE